MTRTEKDKEAQRQVRRANIANGLTWDGRKRINYTWPELAGLTGRKRMNERIRLTKLLSDRSKRNGGIGFLIESKKTFSKSAWRQETIQLRMLIDQFALQLSVVFPALNDGSKVQAIALSRTLAKIRRGIRC